MTTLLAVIALGFFLGMRHATDPDHVIAVTTIVARQRTLKHAAWIGVLWGIGHSVTILLVGAAIILFSVVIPPRIGLTMELSVGLMLVLLGVLNLTGIMRWITDTLSPGLGIRGSRSRRESQFPPVLRRLARSAHGRPASANPEPRTPEPCSPERSPDAREQCTLTCTFTGTTFTPTFTATDRGDTGTLRKRRRRVGSTASSVAWGSTSFCAR